MMTDPIADLLTRMRNALAIRRQHVDMPKSKLKVKIAEVMKREGYIRDFQLLDVGVQGSLRIYLKYGPDGEEVVRKLDRASSPGRRIYHGVGQVPFVLRGLGIGIYSTSKGLKTDKECRRDRVGGELICKIW